jgi:nucleoside-diphosphate-sugar epimerase
VIVIGGTVFIGRAIVARLTAHGHDVAVLHRRDQHDFGPHVRNLQADRGDLAALAAVLRRENPEAVIDVAYDWQKGTTGEQVEAAARALGDRLQRYVFVSSVAAYGPGLDHIETAPLVGADFPRAYAAHKAVADRALFRMHAATGFPVTTVRPPYVHGPQQAFYREQFFWDRLRDGRPIVLPDGGDRLMQWVYVSDLAEVCVRTLDVPAAAGEAFNFAHEPVTQRRFVELLASVAGAEPTLLPVPRDRIHAAGGQLSGERLYFGELLDQPEMTSRVEKAARLLGTAPTPFATALQCTYQWYRAQPQRPVCYSFEDSLLGAV